MAYEDAVHPKYQAALYFAQIRATDDETSMPIDFRVEWDYEAITPYVKGSGPARIETNQDKSVTVAVVGLYLKEGLPLKIVATGYSLKCSAFRVAKVGIWLDPLRSKKSDLGEAIPRLQPNPKQKNPNNPSRRMTDQPTTAISITANRRSSADIKRSAETHGAKSTNHPTD